MGASRKANVLILDNAKRDVFGLAPRIATHGLFPAKALHKRYSS